MYGKRGVVVSLLILLAGLFVATVYGAQNMAGEQQTESTIAGLGAGRSVAALPRQGPTDRAELEAFLDELMAKDMEEYHIAGAAVSVVRDGALFFAKGYGYADLEQRIPVHPEQTLFGTGSVGKTLTWTAVMQLVEQGKLDLDADINTYLDFRIPDTYPEPITLKHLMSHTSGFENRMLASATTDPAELVPAREWLLSHMDARVRPPGESAGYSNYNAMLAGYIVSRVSGQPYDQYIQEHILDPLGMVHATASSPVPPELRPDVSVGYVYVDSTLQPFPGFLAQPAHLPSGAHHASVTDMARYMIAHLQGGRYGDASIPEARILKEATMQQMHTTLYTPDPRLLGNAYGFFDFSDNGQRTLGHIGENAPTMHSLLLLLPDQNLGVFVAYNSRGGTELTSQHFGFQRAFFDHYYAAPAVVPLQPPPDFAERAGRYEGSYRWTMGAETTLLKTMRLFGSAVISASSDGTLLLETPYGDWRFVEVEPLYFRQVDGPYGIAFGEDGQGRITRMYVDLMPQFAFERVGWYETPAFNMALALVSVLIFLVTIPVAAIRLIRERRHGRPAPRVARAAYWLILGISVLNLLYVPGVFVWGVAPVMTAPVQSISSMAKIVLGLGVLSAVLTAGALVYAVFAWKNRYWGVAARAYYTLATLAAVAFVWFLNYWNLLGWRY